MFKKMMVVVVLAGFLSACNSSPREVQVQQVPSQQVVVQQQQGMSTGEAMALGALAGYVVGQTRMPDGSVYRGTPEQKTVINKTYIINHPQAPTPTASAAPTPAPKTGFAAVQKPAEANKSFANVAKPQAAPVNKSFGNVSKPVKTASTGGFGSRKK